MSRCVENSHSYFPKRSQHAGRKNVIMDVKFIEAQNNVKIIERKIKKIKKYIQK
jgi:hypothetical protein